MSNTSNNFITVGNSFDDQQAWAEGQVALQDAAAEQAQARRDFEGDSIDFFTWESVDPESFEATKTWWLSVKGDPDFQATMSELVSESTLTDKRIEIERRIDMAQIMVRGGMITEDHFRIKLRSIGINDLDTYRKKLYAQLASD